MSVVKKQNICGAKTIIKLPKQFMTVFKQ